MSLSVLIQHLYDSPIATAIRESNNLLPVAAGPFKHYTNPLFPVKLALLAVALAAHTWLTRRLTRGEGASNATRVLAATSLLLWTGVVIAGRWLGLI